MADVADDLYAAVADLQDGCALSAREKAQFVLAGFVKVRGVLPCDAVEAAVTSVWAAAEVQEQAIGSFKWPSSWERGDVMMKQQIPSDPFQNHKKLHDALDDLLGHGRWSMEGLDDLGWAPMRFPASKLGCHGRAGSWEVEASRVEAPCQYHLDGSWYQHRLFCPQQAIIICVVLTDTAMGGAGTAAVDVERHPEYEIYCNAGDVLLLHPHLAHSSTTNVRFGRDVRVALTKRAYWITGPAETASLPVEQELDFLVETARNVVASLADPWVIPWLTLKEQLILEASMVTLEEVDARLVECAAVANGFVDLGGLLLTPQTLEYVVKHLRKDMQAQDCSLGLARCGLGPVGSSMLGRLLQPSLALKQLLLQGNSLGDGGVVALLAPAAGTLRRMEILRCLKLNENNIGAAGADALARLLPGLEHLELRNCPIKDEGIFLLKEKLQVFDLERTRLSDAAAALFTEMLSSEVFPCLSCLSLRGCRLTDQGAAPLLRAVCHRGFRRFDLGRNSVGDGTLQVLAELLPKFRQNDSGHFFGLDELLLGTNQVTDVGIESLCYGLACRDKQYPQVFLNLTSNRLISRSLQRITYFLYGCCNSQVLPLSGLDLTYNDMSVESVQEFRAVVCRLSQTFDCESRMWEKGFTAGCG
eukprot:symbB.v1.2.021187.t1/scaffold1779.1/size154953/15